jgi:hypothetical protein
MERDLLGTSASPSREDPVYEAPSLKRFGTFRELTKSSNLKTDIGFDILLNNGQTQTSDGLLPRS